MAVIAVVSTQQPNHCCTPLLIVSRLFTCCRRRAAATSSTQGQLAVSCSGNFAALKAAAVNVQAQLTATCGVSSSNSGNSGRRLTTAGTPEQHVLQLAGSATPVATAQVSPDSPATSNLEKQLIARRLLIEGELDATAAAAGIGTN